MITEYSNYVDGEWVNSESGETFEVVNPADTNEIVARFQQSTAEDAENAIEAAVAAQDRWAGVPGPECGNILNWASQTLENRKQEPLGTVSIITPWNYPIAIPAWKLAPALAAGNTVIAKPASEVPNSTRIIIECLVEAGLPDGVVNYVTGPGSELGVPLTTHSEIDGVSFTGSTAVGTNVAQAASEDLKRVQCEMGERIQLS